MIKYPNGPAGWVIPPNVFNVLTSYRPSAVAFYLRRSGLLRKNRALRDRHLGESCFIMGNGPSIGNQDIRPLRDRTVFSVSNGFHHPDYEYVRPRYHCVPQLTLRHLSRAKAIEWFREMDSRIGSAELFLSSAEHELVRDHNLFPGREAYFLCFGKRHFSAPRMPDISRLVPAVETVPVMAMMVALYMGFKRIYLIGFDHDWFVKRRYDYFFDRSKLKWKDPTVSANGVLETTLVDELPGILRVWLQHAALAEIAAHHGVSILNATDGGLLDVYPRVDLKDALRHPSC